MTVHRLHHSVETKRASNCTLQQWYGSNEELFSAMIVSNAYEAARLLEDTCGDDLDARMHAFGAALLRVVTGTRAVALGRAASTDASKPANPAAPLSARGARASLRSFARSPRRRGPPAP
jgi:hypothetical protein